MPGFPEVIESILRKLLESNLHQASKKINPLELFACSPRGLFFKDTSSHDANNSVSSKWMWLSWPDIAFKDSKTNIGRGQKNKAGIRGDQLERKCFPLENLKIKGGGFTRPYIQPDSPPRGSILSTVDMRQQWTSSLADHSEKIFITSNEELLNCLHESFTHTVWEKPTPSTCLSPFWWGEETRSTTL